MCNFQMHDQLVVVVVVEHHAAISDYFFFCALRLSLLLQLLSI